MPRLTPCSGGAPLGKDLVQSVVKKLRQMGNTQVCVSQGTLISNEVVPVY